MEDRADPAEIWTRTLRSLDGQALSRSQRAFLQVCRLENIYGSVAILAAPNPFAKDVLESRLRPPIENALGVLLGREVNLAVTVNPSLAFDEDLADIWADATYADAIDVTAPQPALRGVAPRPPPRPCRAAAAPARAASRNRADAVSRAHG